MNQTKDNIIAIILVLCWILLNVGIALFIADFPLNLMLMLYPIQIIANIAIIYIILE